MYYLGRSLLTVRFVLAWFILALGVASASPMMQQHTAMLICAEGGNKIVFVDSDGNQVDGAKHSSLDCPLCLPATLPPAFITLNLPVEPPMACSQHAFISAHIAALVGAPLPARGPPLPL